MSVVLERERQKDLRDIKNLMDSESGRRIIWRVFDKSHVFATSFNPDTSVMAFNEGERNVALTLLADVMEVAPKKFQVMLLEAKERRDLVEKELEKEQEAIDEQLY